MEKRALKALKKSIEEKWSKIVTDCTVVDKGTINCELCIEFGYSCKGCPVMERTGKSQCLDTPWYKWREHTSTHNDGAHRKPGCEECLILAQKELVFLESLLPSSNFEIHGNKVDNRIRNRRIKDRRTTPKKAPSPDYYIGRRNDTQGNRRNCKSCNRREIRAGRRIGFNDNRKNRDDRRK